MKNYPLVLVEWVDSSSSHGWKSIEEAIDAKTPVIYTAGWLLDKNDERCILVTDWSPIRDDTEVEICNRHLIPMGMVKKIRKLTLPNHWLIPYVKR